MLHRRPWFVSLLLDLSAVVAAFFLALQVLPALENLFETTHKSPGLAMLLPSLLASIAILIPVLFLIDGYSIPSHWRKLRILRMLVLAHAILATVYLLASAFMSEVFAPGRKSVLVMCGFSVLLLWYWRVTYPQLFGRVDRKRRAILVGAHTFAIRSLQRYAREHQDAFEIFGVVDDFRSATYFGNLGIEHCGTSAQLETILKTRPADTLLVLTDQTQYASRIIELLDKFPTVQEVYVRAQVPLAVAQDIDLLFIQEVPLLKVYAAGKHTSGEWWRTAFDRSIAFVGLMLVAPVMLVVMALIKLDSPGPIFYRQRRLGRHNEPFWIYKFRSMVANAEQKSGAVLAQKNDPRVTRLGRIMRMLRIDELPQIWNVLMGDMSLIGPRPERPEFQNVYRETIPWYSLRSLCKPGITGLAQVSGDYHTSAQRKLLYDVTYLANMGPLLDLRILLATVLTVLTKKGH